MDNTNGQDQPLSISKEFLGKLPLFSALSEPDLERLYQALLGSTIQALYFTMIPKISPRRMTGGLEAIWRPGGTEYNDGRSRPCPHLPIPAQRTTKPVTCNWCC